MITAKFSVQQVDKGWAVRIGPDVLVRSSTRGQALLQADWRAAAIRRLGGRAIVVEETPPAFESVALGRPPRRRMAAARQSAWSNAWPLVDDRTRTSGPILTAQPLSTCWTENFAVIIGKHPRITQLYVQNIHQSLEVPRDLVHETGLSERTL